MGEFEIMDLSSNQEPEKKPAPIVEKLTTATMVLLFCWLVAMTTISVIVVARWVLF